MKARKKIKYGVEIDMTATMLKQLNPFVITDRKVSGILVSMASMSLLNRFKMRPIGVDSKKFIPNKEVKLFEVHESSIRL